MCNAQGKLPKYTRFLNETFFKKDRKENKLVRKVQRYGSVLASNPKTFRSLIEPVSLAAKLVYE